MKAKILTIFIALGFMTVAHANACENKKSDTVLKGQKLSKKHLISRGTPVDPSVPKSKDSAFKNQLLLSGRLKRMLVADGSICH